MAVIITIFDAKELSLLINTSNKMINTKVTQCKLYLHASGVKYKLLRSSMNLGKT